eukprot:361005-Chlamydomonas_euryale.AAC.15
MERGRRDTKKWHMCRCAIRKRIMRRRLQGALWPQGCGWGGEDGPLSMGQATARVSPLETGVFRGCVVSGFVQRWGVMWASLREPDQRLVGVEKACVEEDAFVEEGCGERVWRDHPLALVESSRKQGWTVNVGRREGRDARSVCEDTVNAIVGA